MARLNWTDLSIDDMINIAKFISKDPVKYPVIQIKRIRERARILKTQPLLGRIVPEMKDETIRELILGNYRIIYKISSKDRIDILFVDQTPLKKRGETEKPYE